MNVAINHIGLTVGNVDEAVAWYTKVFLNYCTAQHIAFIPYGSLGAHPLKRGAPLAKADGVLAPTSV